MVGNRGNRYFPCMISWEARYVQFLLCSVSTVLFLSPQPAFCLHKEQKAHLKPGAMVVQKKKSKKNKKKKLGQRSWFGPRRRRYGDKGGASSHGLTPVGSKPADKQILSTLLFHLPTTHQPRLSYHRQRKKTSLRFAFVHINKPITLVKQYIWEERG